VNAQPQKLLSDYLIELVRDKERLAAFARQGAADFLKTDPPAQELTEAQLAALESGDPVRIRWVIEYERGKGPPSEGIVIVAS
jgi:hypothetical protein